MKIGPFFNRRSKPAPLTTGPERQQKPVATTFTGELVQPVRLHYEVQDTAAVAKALAQLECVGAGNNGTLYKWYLAAETKGAFKANKALPRGEDVVLGDIRFDPSSTKLTILVRSIERAWYAIEFFDRHIGRKLMKVTEMDAYNHLFEATPENLQRLTDLASLFPEAQITKRDVSAIPKIIKNAKKAGAGQEDMIEAVWSFIEKDKNIPLPDIERMPLYFYKDGIASIQSKLLMRQRVAWEHFNGNMGYNLFTAIQDSIQGK